MTVSDNITVLPWNADFDCSWITEQYNAGNFANAICNGTNPIDTISQATDSNGTSNGTSTETSTGASTANTKTTTILVAVVVAVVSLALLGAAVWLELRRLKRRRQSRQETGQDNSYRRSELPAETFEPGA